MQLLPPVLLYAEQQENVAPYREETGSSSTRLESSDENRAGVCTSITNDKQKEDNYYL